MDEEVFGFWEEWQQYFSDFFSPENFTVWMSTAFKVMIILLASYIVLKFANRLIDSGFALRRLVPDKQQTLSKLLKSIVRYAVFFIAGLTILRNVGLDPTPVLAGAGVAGLAIGFGAQNLVRDVITGFFIIFEDQFSVNDYVLVNNSIEGTVEEMGLRVTRIRDWSGMLHHISNGEITQITNFNREQMRPQVHVRVPYEENMEQVFQQLEHVCRQVGQEQEEYLLENPSVFGITDIKEGGVQFTIMALSVPDRYWFMERQMRKKLIEVFQEEKIEITYPRRVYTEGRPPMFARSGDGQRTIEEEN